MQIKDVLVVGGDLRQIYLANRLSQINKNDVQYRVYAYALEKNADNLKNVTVVDKIEQIKKNIDIVILPMPVLDIKENINTPLSDLVVKTKNIIQIVEDNCIVFGGKIPKDLIKSFDDKNIRCFDYLQREELAVHNAIPTAEGTLQIIMEETAKTIFGSNILIVGAGRISKILRKYLVGLGANVIVSARKAEDYAWIETDKCKFINNKNIKNVVKDVDVIINTVPVKILDKDILTQINNETLIIDLASKPGGVDFETAKRLGKKTIWALSLPGKVAPITAGHIILNTILNILEELEEKHE